MSSQIDKTDYCWQKTGKEYNQSYKNAEFKSYDFDTIPEQ